MIRDDIKAAQVAAMKSGDKARLGTIRLMLAKIKDKDIELRTASSVPGTNSTAPKKWLATMKCLRVS